MKQSKGALWMMGILYGAITLTCVFGPKEEYSFSERRKLAAKPEFTVGNLLDGSYMAQAEKYVTDHFFQRDSWRRLKAAFSLGVMKKMDNNGIYEKDGYLCAMEYPMDEESVARAGKLFTEIYEKYLKESETKSYLAVIPDKSCFLAGENYLTMDYELFLKEIEEQTVFAAPIPIQQLLTISDYYKTDTHWRQEEITDVANYLAEAMGTSLTGNYQVKAVESPFYGVYYGQAAVMASPDTIRYCTNDVLEQCRVFDYENNREIPLYDLSKAEGKDPYELFFGGNISLATIENPVADTDRELVVFGDSFARSLLPLLSEGYAKITLIDIRYLPSAYVGKYVTFLEQDVLFLYSTSVLNNSITLK